MTDRPADPDWHPNSPSYRPPRDERCPFHEQSRAEAIRMAKRLDAVMRLAERLADKLDRHVSGNQLGIWGYDAGVEYAHEDMALDALIRRLGK